MVLRGDIDALPITEQSGAAFSSEHPGNMHACGHDFHATAMLRAAILLKQQENKLADRVRIIFHAAKETGQGAPAVIASGALESAFVLFGVHNDPSLPANVTGSKPGPLTAAVDRFSVTITGTGSHAAKPQQGNDPIVAAAQIVSAVQTLISRNTCPAESAVVSVTQIHSGSTWNVISKSAWLEGTVRTFTPGARAIIARRFRKLVTGIADAFAINALIEWHAGPPAVINEGRWTEFALHQARVSGLEERIIAASPISEDFAFYQQHLPGAFLMTGTGQLYPLHHPAFSVNDEVLFPAAQYLADLAKAALQ